MGIMQKSLWLLSGCIVLGASLVYHLPAQWIVPEHSGKFRFLGIGGSFWDGEVEQILREDKPLPIRNLNWTINPATLFTGSLKGDFHEQPTPTNRGQMRFSLWSRRFELQSLHWQLPDGSLDPWFRAGVSLKGEFVLDLQTLQLPPGKRLPSQLEGRLNWKNAALQMDSGYWPIGSPVLQFSGEGDAIDAVLTNAQPALPGDGRLRCTAGNCRVELSLQPTPDAPQSLLNGLLFLGLQPTGNGYSGQLNFPVEYP